MFVDLSVPIEEHWRYPFKRELVSSFEKGDKWQVSGFYMKSHWFSHIDFPRHTGAEYPDSEDFSLENYNGMASVIDVYSPGMVNRAITADILKNAVGERKLHNIILIRSRWNTECEWKTKEFWTKAPYLTEDAFGYLAELSPTAIGFDFPQDYTIRELIDRPVGPEEQLSHIILLRERNILLIEYVTNFDKIPGDECELFCLPLKIAHVDGCPVRCVARV